MNVNLILDNPELKVRSVGIIECYEVVIGYAPNRSSGKMRVHLARARAHKNIGVLESVRHPGYFRLEENVLDSGAYRLSLVPITEDTMRKFVKDFDNEYDELCALETLEYSIDRIDDAKVREEALRVYEILFTEAMDEFIRKDLG